MNEFERVPVKTLIWPGGPETSGKPRSLTEGILCGSLFMVREGTPTCFETWFIHELSGREVARYHPSHIETIIWSNHLNGKPINRRKKTALDKEFIPSHFPAVTA